MKALESVQKAAAVITLLVAPIVGIANLPADGPVSWVVDAAETVAIMGSTTALALSVADEMSRALETAIVATTGAS